MRPKKLTSAHRINRATVWAYSLMSILLLIAYLLEFVKGSRTIGYTAVVAILDLVPYIMCLVAYRKNVESNIVKYTVTIGFSLLYSFALLTAAVPTTYVYVFLVFVAIIPYGEMKLCYIMGGITTLANIISVVIGFANGSLTSDDLAMVEIQLIAIILASLFTGLATKVIGNVNKHRMDVIHREKEKVNELLEHTLGISKGISEDISAVNRRMNKLNESTVTTKDSMQDVSIGANETAEAMQSQLLQTEEIMERVEKAKDVSKTIAEDIQQTEEAVSVGKGNIEHLLTSVKQSDQVSSLVISKMNELSENTDKMNSIVEMINSVTKKTSLLSLNASIEAARAGEAGKGFAVVAGEISNLAKQTSDATISITALIGEIALSINDVSTAINQLVESNKEQNHSVETMAHNFEKIATCSDNINKVSETLKDVIGGLAKSNEEIVQNINNVSAVTQEVSARANETLSESEHNAMVVEEIALVIKELSMKAEKLIKS